MAVTYHCARGHEWVGDPHDSKPRFCAACGLRLYPDGEFPTLPVRLFRDIRTSTANASPTTTAAATAPTSMFTKEWKSFEMHANAEKSRPGSLYDIQEIPGYELLGVLGNGGMGMVFRAKDSSLKRQVALKVILKGRDALPADRARLQQEAEAVARLHHPNIVQIFEVGEQEGMPYMALEFINAGNLAQFLRGKPEAPESAAQFLKNVAETIHYAHSKGIIHRDLKPANLLLNLEEGRLQKGKRPNTAVLDQLCSYTHKIGDFGLAQHMGGEETSGLVGTPSYMAPEQASGNGQSIGPGVDIYALGAIFYELLTGRPPFQGETLRDVIRQVIHQPPTPPSKLQPKIPRDLEIICMTCLQKDPARRYESAQALADDLNHFLKNEPIAVRYSGWHERTWKWLLRNPMTLANLIVSTVLLGVVLWNWVRTTADLQRERDAAQASLRSAEESLHGIFESMETQIRKAEAEPDGDMSPRRRWMWAMAVGYYQGWVEKANTEPSQKVHLGKAHLRLGELHAKLGDQAAAKASFRRAADVFQELSVAHPDRTDYAQQLETSRSRSR